VSVSACRATRPSPFDFGAHALRYEAQQRAYAQGERKPRRGVSGTPRDDEGEDASCASPPRVPSRPLSGQADFRYSYRRYRPYFP
jgi:hypothetical protein